MDGRMDVRLGYVRIWLRARLKFWGLFYRCGTSVGVCLRTQLDSALCLHASLISGHAAFAAAWPTILPSEFSVSARVYKLHN